MQIDVEEQQLSVVLEEAKFDVVITAGAPLQVNVGESAKIEVGQAINYIKSGEAEINAAVAAGTTAFNANAIAKTNAFNQNASDKTTAFDDNATSKTGDFNTNASDKTTAFNSNASDKTSAFNQNATDKTTAFNNNASSKTSDFNDNYTAKLGDFNDNASDKTGDFNSNASDKTSDFNDNYLAKKEIIDGAVSDAQGYATSASGYATTAKQYAIGDPSEPTGNSAKYWAEQASSSLSGLTSRVSTIEGKIPSAASASNQLADKDYVDTADSGLQQQIDAITAASDVTDIVGTYAQLQAYDTSSLPNNSIIKVLQDESRDDETTYYRWIITGGVGAWVLIGEEGPYYTIAAADATFQEKLVSGTNIKTINNNSIVGSGNLDINGLPTQTGQSGKFLSTDGTDASWQNISVNPDSKSITTNASNQLQTIGVINQNDTTTAIKTWTGTKAQYEAIASKDSNTLYEVEGYGVFLGTTQIAAGSAELTNPFTLFQYQFTDHILNNASWLRADTFSWQSGEVYVSAYEHLVDDIDGVTAETETIGSNTITFYRATDGHKICLADQENIVAAIYSDKGVAWYYILDTANTRFKLPRTKFGATGLRGAVGDYVAAGLPNITGEVAFSSGAVSGKLYKHYPYLVKGAFSRGSNTENVSNDGVSSHTTASGSALFNASNSSSIYGNSTTVQPRATEMYLYFYVGETIQDATLIDVGEITDTLNGKADVDGSNMAASVKNFDGQWVASSAILVNAVTAPTSTGLDYSLSSYLPNDGYNYEVLFDIEGASASSSGSYTVGYLKTDISNDCWVCEGRAQSNSGVRAAGNAILPVGTGRSVTIGNSSRNTGTITLYARGYRRIGTNS